MDGFSCTYYHEGCSGVLVVCGELDVCTAERLESALSLLPPTDLVIDCAGIRFIDSSGLRPLERAARRCFEIGKGFALRQVPQSMTRVIDLIGLAELLSPGPVSTAGRPVGSEGRDREPAADPFARRRASTAIGGSIRLSHRRRYMR